MPLRNADRPLPIQIKATRDGFTLVPDATTPFQEIMRYMKHRLDESHDFFYHSEMSLDLSARPLQTDQILELRCLLAEKAGVKLVEVKMREDLVCTLEPARTRPKAAPQCSSPRNREVTPMIVRSTCRSGTRIESPADCVVLGDVNPGAEVIAVGDIIVFGSLRGVAHAGATGDCSARIWALSIEPSQIRIADLVALPPAGNKPTPKRFEIAEIQNNMIQVLTL
ncbi:septum site-determining protein MinC [Desulfoferrobacter suflitae]|uniref:septum site-determining protein MinC n=1 Tax=Desulfoferrobacter suflitae TaxID=2865782 RepID=UPI0021648261|nr:septum site-determining protein MinC [Desulfoferrobacter suflitae]MCK8603962.1 septum site-determining protein MinC [Desulfoferrobacter suflitae]